MQITVYDGVETIGGNKILLEEKDLNLLFDFGINFHLRGQYFEEYLLPRSGRGLLDLIHTGLLPAIRGIYRGDLEPPDVDVWDRARVPYPIREVDVQAVLLSHAHLDHSGHISFLKQDIPIVSSLCTAFMAKAIQDSSKTDYEKEVCYLVPKVEEDGLLKSGHFGKYPAQQRRFCVCDCDPSEQGREFWQSLPGSRKLLPAAQNRVGSVNGHAVKAFPVDHSIFGATAYAVETSQGWVVYTGDLRVHGKHGQLTKSFAEAAKELHPVVLICEGTHVATEKPIDEAGVCAKAFDVVKSCDQLVIADFGPRNLERLLTFRQIAKDCRRRLVVTAKDLYLLEAASLSGIVSSPNEDDLLWLYDEPKKPQNWEKSIYGRYEGRSVPPKLLRENGGEYILCFSYWDINELIEIDPNPGALYIYSTSEAFDEEQRFDIVRLRNWLQLFGILPVGVPDAKTGKLVERDKGLHASGHITGPDLLEVISTIGPQYVVPVHTENVEFFLKNLGAKRVRPPTKGIPITL